MCDVWCVFDFVWFYRYIYERRPHHYEVMSIAVHHHHQYHRMVVSMLFVWFLATCVGIVDFRMIEQSMHMCNDSLRDQFRDPCLQVWLFRKPNVWNVRGRQNIELCIQRICAMVSMVDCVLWLWYARVNLIWNHEYDFHHERRSGRPTGSLLGRPLGRPVGPVRGPSVQTLGASLRANFSVKQTCRSTSNMKRNQRIH